MCLNTVSKNFVHESDNNNPKASIFLPDVGR